MKFSKWLFAVTMLIAWLTQALPASAVVIGQVDDFEDGTTQGWVVGLLGAPHPVPPVNIPDGGPLGAGDNYLRLTSLGGSGAGSRLAAINLTQWSGDYTAVGLTEIAMDLRNLGQTDLTIRLFLELTMAGPPTDTAISAPIVLPAGGVWTHAEFAIELDSLIELTGDLSTLLANVTALRIVHSPTAAFPGPPSSALLGIDNITARSTNVVPEPSAFPLLALVLAGLLAWSGLMRR
jgi:hypothetical protein